MNYLPSADFALLVLLFLSVTSLSSLQIFLLLRDDLPEKLKRHNGHLLIFLWLLPIISAFVVFTRTRNALGAIALFMIIGLMYKLSQIPHHNPIKTIVGAGKASHIKIKKSEPLIYWTYHTLFSIFVTTIISLVLLNWNN